MNIKAEETCFKKLQLYVSAELKRVTISVFISHAFKTVRI